MKLKNKLFFVILVSLFFQIVLSASFVVFTFLDLNNLRSIEDLNSDWHRTKLYIERLKHYSISQIFNITRFIYNNKKFLDEKNFLAKSVKLFKVGEDVDYIIILDKNNRVLANYFTDTSGIYPQISKIVSRYDFYYPKNEFIHYSNNYGNKVLFLVTGTKYMFEYNGIREYTILLIKNINTKLVNSMSQELGINFAFFVGNDFICSSIPFFKLPDYSKSIQNISTTTGNYNMLIKILSSSPYQRVSLAVLRSTLDKKIYTRNLIKSLLLAFLITLCIVIIFALSMTAYFTSPFAKLQIWIDNYMKNRKLSDLKINKKDDIGFLANSFYSMGKKIIEEEKLIKSQLKQITFLNKYNENILKNLKAGVLVINHEFKIEYVNDFIINLLKKDAGKILYLSLNDFFKKYFKLPENKNNINFKKDSQIENIIYKKNKNEILKFVLKIIPLDELRTLIVFEDVTLAEKFWQKMSQAEKISSLGILTMGMAHEINNPLGSILSHVQYLIDIEDNKEKYESLKWIENETGRIADLIQKLLDFSRSYNEFDGALCINNTINEVLELLKFKINNKKINIKNNLIDKQINVKINPGALKQVLLNIFINSIQAVNREGTIIIDYEIIKNYIYLCIIDNGIGISKKDLRYIFDPFFTTKKNKGTGLGLSISYSIIKRCGGDIIARSEKNKGTLIKIKLPIYKEIA